MKETDSLETRLRSWRPRRASAKLEWQLFAGPAVWTSKMAWLAGSLAPAAACLLLTLSTFDHTGRGVAVRSDPMIAMILSNQSFAAYAPDSFPKGENRLATVTFEWTNRSVSPSSMSPF